MFVLRFTALLAFGLMASCTLIVSPEPGQSCTDDDQCAATSMLAGYPATCLKYFCNEGTCLEYEDGDEVCDGWDNDCDGIIDEPSDVGDEPWRASTVVAEGVPLNVPISYGASSWALNVSWAEGGRGRQVTVGDAVVTPEPLSYLFTDPGNGDLNDPPALGAGCSYASDRLVECDIAAVASAPTHQDRQRQLIATVTTAFCGVGTILIGQSPPPADVAGVPVVLGDPDMGDSNLLAGIDTGEGGCTGASRSECDGIGEGCGAGRPQISVIASEIPMSSPERRVAEGLVAWVGDTVERSHCGGAVAPVEAVVAHMQRRANPGEVFWVTSSGNAIPERLGETMGGGAPALSAWMGRGWVVAFGNAAGNVQLLWIPSQPPPPMSPSTDLVPELEGVTVLGEIPATGADHVVMAIGSERSSGLEIGLAWLEGCGTAAQRVVFRRARATLSGENLSAVEALGGPVELEASTSSLGAPALAYSRANFLAPGTMRGDELVSDDNSGGWIAVWSSGVDANGDGRPNDGPLFGARIAEVDNTALELADFNVRGDAPYIEPTGRFVFRGNDGTLRSGAAVCSQ